MEVLIVLATSIAYLYSVIIIVANMIMKVPSPMAFFDVAPSQSPAHCIARLNRSFSAVHVRWTGPMVGTYRQGRADRVPSKGNVHETSSRLKHRKH